MTFELCGRLGDSLISYLHAKWISYQYNLPLICKSFSYSADLVLDEKELGYFEIWKYPHVQQLTNVSQLSDQKDGTLFSIPYYTDIEWECKNFGTCYFKIDWKDETFRRMAKEMIAPKQPLQLILPAPETINIAMHIREGGGFDGPDLGLIFPVKAPPLSFYIDSLLRVMDLLAENALFCFVFTDARDPQVLVKKIQERIPPHARIRFGCRTENHFSINVLEDFFSLFHFDILIRPQSNFSLVPSLIHDYAIVCSPLTASRYGNKIVIDHIDLCFDEELLKKCQERVHLRRIAF